MGFGGSVQAMITVLKNNEKMRSRRSKRKSLDGSYAKVRLKFPNTATKEDLKKIEVRLQQERKQTRIKQYVVFAFVLSLLLILIGMYI